MTHSGTPFNGNGKTTSTSDLWDTINCSIRQHLNRATSLVTCPWLSKVPPSCPRWQLQCEPRPNCTVENEKKTSKLSFETVIALTACSLSCCREQEVNDRVCCVAIGQGGRHDRRKQRDCRGHHDGTSCRFGYFRPSGHFEGGRVGHGQWRHGGAFRGHVGLLSRQDNQPKWWYPQRSALDTPT
jgi:hypothetical protein